MNFIMDFLFSLFGGYYFFDSHISPIENWEKAMYVMACVVVIRYVGKFMIVLIKKTRGTFKLW